MSILHIILPILVGSVIGYCTNYIAIKMLFRPHKAVYIGKHQLPFTPGIIPKNQKRIARAIGDAVSSQLLTKEALMDNLGEAGEKAISSIASKIRSSETSILQMLPEEAGGEKIIDSVSAGLARSLTEKAKQADIETIIAKYGQDALNSLLGGNRMLAMLVTADVQNRLYSKLSVAARNFLDTRGEDVIRDFLDSYIKEMANKPVNELVSAENQDRIQAALESAIKNAIAQHGANLLEQIDIRGITERRIEEMDMDELEELVLSVMKQELQAVINLGALIGAVIGVINIFL